MLVSWLQIRNWLKEKVFLLMTSSLDEEFHLEEMWKQWTNCFLLVSSQQVHLLLVRTSSIIFFFNLLFNKWSFSFNGEASCDIVIHFSFSLYLFFCVSSLIEKLNDAYLSAHVEKLIGKGCEERNVRRKTYFFN